MNEPISNDKYFKLLAGEYKTVREARGEILRLQALRELPKGTEYFFSDLHGEDGSFIHLMRSASGNIRTKIRELYGNLLTEVEQNQLANLVYDPQQIINLIRQTGRETNEWIRITIIRLSELCRYISSKYAREDVQRKMPVEYAAVLTELLYVGAGDFDRQSYNNRIIAYIIQDGNADDFICSLCEMIQRICVNYLHIIGDIYDRGNGPHRIMEELIEFDEVDIQWGNHDALWMGAAAGNEVSMCNVIRAGIRYNLFDALEDGYSLNLRALSNFAQEVYKGDPATQFVPKSIAPEDYDAVDMGIVTKMHKAISILQFKLEGQLLERHPEYGMEDRIVLKKIDYERMVYIHDGQEYPLLDTHFPTIDPKDPLKLSRQEEDLMAAIRSSFMHSEPLHRHISFLYSHGSMYKSVNNNLLYHGCVPMNEDGSFTEIEFDGRTYSGRSLMNYFGVQMTTAYHNRGDEAYQNECDMMWYLWCGAKSPLFGKSKMATFEIYFLADKSTHKEISNPYYKFTEDPDTCDRIFDEFGLDKHTAHIINGHVPVKSKDGEKPVKAGGKLFVIDGGISKAYHSKTGIAGYTLIFNSHHLALAEHHNFAQIESDMGSYTPNMQIVDVMPKRLSIADTDLGTEIDSKIKDLETLIDAYEKGLMKMKMN